MMNVKSITAFVLSNPIVFNQVRKLIAGDQANTKDFIKNALIKYRVKSVLDVGCGTGDFFEAVPTTVNYLGIDINKQFILFARSHYGSKNNQFITQDLTSNQFSLKQKFDAVLLISMLHHLSDIELETILSKIKKITTKVVIIADIIPEPPGPLRKLMVKMDQGKYIRKSGDKLKILAKYFSIEEKKLVFSRLAVQFGVICTP